MGTKDNVKGGVCNVCKAVEDMIKENEIEVTERVEREVTKKNIISMIEKGFTDEQILSVFEISEEQLKEIKNIL